MKPQCGRPCMDNNFPRDIFQVSTIGLSRIAGAQFKLPYIHRVVNNSYLGPSRQRQRGFHMDGCVQLGLDNIDAPQLDGYGVDHKQVVDGLGCKLVRVYRQQEITYAIKQAEQCIAEFKVPVMIEVMRERVTNLSIATEADTEIDTETETDAIDEFEQLANDRADAPTAVGLPD